MLPGFSFKLEMMNSLEGSKLFLTSMLYFWKNAKIQRESGRGSQRFQLQSKRMLVKHKVLNFKYMLKFTFADLFGITHRSEGMNVDTSPAAWCQAALQE